MDLQVENVNDEIVEKSHFCAACGEFPIDNHDNLNSKLCTACRERYTKLAVPKWVIAFITIMIAVTLIMIPIVFPDFKTSIKANREMKNREYALAYQDYSSLLKKYGGSKELAKKTFIAAFKAQYFKEAANILNESLVDKEFAEKDFQLINNYSKKLNMFYMTINDCETILGAVADYEYQKYTLESYLKDEKYSKSVIYYYLYALSSENPTYEMRYLQLASEQNEGFTYLITEYGNALRSAGDIDQAHEILKDALENNVTDSNAIRGIGIVQMLKNQPEAGLKNIEKAYDLNPSMKFMPETLVIALCENNQREKALKFMNVKQKEGTEFDQGLFDYLDGNITLENYYI